MSGKSDQNLNWAKHVTVMTTLRLSQLISPTNLRCFLSLGSKAD